MTDDINKMIPIFCAFQSASIGFEWIKQLGFKIVLGNELNPIRYLWSCDKYPDAEIIKGSFTDPKIFAQLVCKFVEKGCKIGTFSPCCQPFAKAGKQHLHSTEAFLFLYILLFIRLTRMESGWIENAEEFQNAVLDDDGRTVEQRIRDTLEPLGYHVEVKTQDCAGFGTPQHRRRTIVLFSRVGIWKHPQECDESQYATAESAIGNLPPVAAGQRSGIPLHNGPSMPKCQVDMLHGVKEGESPKQFVNADGSFPKKPKPKFVGYRNPRNKPWGTIVQKSASISGYNTVHYEQNRTLTTLETILLTGLPQDWFIPLWARNDEQLIRDVIGESFAPHHVKALLQSYIDCIVKKP